MNHEPEARTRRAAERVRSARRAPRQPVSSSGPQRARSTSVTGKVGGAARHAGRARRHAARPSSRPAVVARRARSAQLRRAIVRDRRNKTRARSVRRAAGQSSCNTTGRERSATMSSREVTRRACPPPHDWCARDRAANRAISVAAGCICRRDHRCWIECLRCTGLVIFRSSRSRSSWPPCSRPAA
jgi:hypothetical protein